MIAQSLRRLISSFIQGCSSLALGTWMAGLFAWRAPYHLFALLRFQDPGQERATIAVPNSGTLIPSNGRYEDLEEYKYKRLPSNRHVRLLVLKGSYWSKGSALEIKLVPIALDTTTSLIHQLGPNQSIYHAVSYTWDGQERDRYILCDGNRLKVTPNCEKILRSLQMRFVSIRLWIDAICINQDSIEEQSIQVPLMSEIYKRAWSVKLWLGDSSPGTRLVYHYTYLFWCCSCLPKSTEEKLHAWLRSYITEHEHERFFLDLMRRNWFRRVWTIQEVALAAKYATIVHCGSDIIAFEMLNGALHDILLMECMHGDHTFNTLILSTYLLAHQFPLLEGSHHVSDTPQIDTCLMMHRNRACGVSDDKDRVYGLYGIFQQLGTTIPQPNYIKTKDEIYWESMVAICQQEQKLDLLMLVSGLISNPNVPSWVPAFDGVFRAGDLFDTGRAAKDSKPLFEFVEGNSKLIAVGKLIDIVKKKSNLTSWQPEGDKYELATIQDGPRMNLEEGFQQTVQAFQDWYELLIKYGSITQYGTFQKVLDAFRDALTLGVDLHHLIFSMVSPKWEKDSMWWWISILKGDEVKEDALNFVKSDFPHIYEMFYDNPESRHLTESEEWQRLCAAKTWPLTARLHHAIWMFSRDRTFFLTRGGFMGTALHSVEEGDSIVLISGLEKPMVLRQVSEYEWQVVCPAYVSGWMKGELWIDEAPLVEFCLV